MVGYYLFELDWLLPQHVFSMNCLLTKIIARFSPAPQKECISLGLGGFCYWAISLQKFLLMF